MEWQLNTLQETQPKMFWADQKQATRRQADRRGVEQFPGHLLQRNLTQNLQPAAAAAADRVTGRKHRPNRFNFPLLGLDTSPRR
jgi:hypothetical protein